ncbi:MAG: hypothetical protein P9M14_06325 [Candidatus Alcyoniella australis]|nr:hypothetical protein [Candidatus Alcyoniella australis]
MTDDTPQTQNDTAAPERLDRARLDLDDREVAELFFGLDITAEAFIFERQDEGRGSLAAVQMRRPESQSDLAFISTAISAMLREWTSRPRNLAYVGLAALLLLLIWNFEPFSENARERLIAMIPPEIDLPKPPPPPPPEPTPPPPEPEPTPESTPEPIPDEQLDRLQDQQDRQLEDLRQQMEIERREDEQRAGVKVDAARRDDVVADLPSAFGNTDRNDDDARPLSLSNIGTRRTGPGDGAGGGPLKVGTPGRGRSGTGDGEELAPVSTRKKTPPRANETVSGRWVRVSNLGPLAHLNARCYGKFAGSIVLAGSYKLRCSDNQIIEAWKKE